MGFRKIAYACAFTLLTLTSILSEEPWSQYRGSNATGVSTSNQFLPGQLNKDTLAWKTVIPHGVSSPCVQDGRAFLTGHDRESKELIVFCIATDSGEQLWEKRTQLENIPDTHVANSPAAPTIASDGERIYVYFGLLGLQCLDLEGNEIWKKTLPVPKNRHGAGSSPVLFEDRLYLVCDQGELFRSLGSYAICLNKRTGEEIWRKDRPLCGAGWSTPVLWNDNRELVVLGRRLIAYDVDTGEERWWVDGLMDFALTTPVVTKERLIAVTAAGGFEGDTRIRLPSFDEVIRQYDNNDDGKLQQGELPADMIFYQGDTTGLPGDGVTAREGFAMFDGDHDQNVVKAEWDGAIGLWNQLENTLVAIRPGGNGDVTKSHVVWKADKQLPEVPSPLIVDQQLYLVKNGGIVSCLDIDTGALVYRKRINAPGNYFSSPVSGDGKVYMAADKGTVTVLAAGQQFDVISRNYLDEQIIATPAIAEGKIFVRSVKHLWCFHAPMQTPQGNLDTILLHQRASGGWPKNYDRRQVLSDADRVTLRANRETNDATIDNGATHTEIRLLAKAFTKFGERRYRDSALSGIEYLLDAQYQNGGWPQRFPNPRGYSQHITFNDNAMIGVMELLRDVAKGQEPFGFISDSLRSRSETAVARGVDCILACQFVKDGKRTVWCAQHDQRSLLPAKARSYELPSLSGSESVGIIRFLMQLPDPSPQVTRAISASIDWFEAAKLHGVKVERVAAPGSAKGYDRVVVLDESAPPMWARFYDLDTNKPIFCSRDGVPKASLAEISYERRNGYSWLGHYAQSLEKEFREWQRRQQ